MNEILHKLAFSTLLFVVLTPIVALTAAFTGSPTMHVEASTTTVSVLMVESTPASFESVVDPLEAFTEPFEDLIDIDAQNTEITEVETAYSQEDYDLMVMLLTGECQNQGWDCQIAVGSVALNRVAHDSYPDTLEEVLYQKSQYACFRDGNAYREPTELSKEVADYLLTNGSQLPSNVIYQAQFKQGSGVYAKIGTEIFCYE